MTRIMAAQMMVIWTGPFQNQNDNSCAGIFPNLSLQQEQEQPTQTTALIKGVFLTITLTLSLVFNTVSLVVLHRVRDRSLNHVTKIFMISFTLCDIFGIFVVYIPMTVATFFQGWPFGEVLCVANGFCSTIFAYTSGIQLIALNLERYLAITYPLKWYNVYVTPKRAKIVVATLWISAIFFSTLAYFLLPNRYTSYNNEYSLCTSNPCDTVDISGSILIFIFAFSPVIMTLVLWLKLYLLARRHARSIIAQVHSVNSTPPGTPPPTPSGATAFRRQDNPNLRSGVDNPSYARKGDRGGTPDLPSTPPPTPSGTTTSFNFRKQDIVKVHSVNDTPPGTPPPTPSGTASFRRQDNPSVRSCVDNPSFTRKNNRGGTMDLLNRAVQINQVEQAMIKSNRKAFYTFCLMSICLALISLPFITVLIYDNIKFQVHVLPHGFIALSQLLIVSFGFLNVLIYYARNKAFRKTAKKLFFKRSSDPYRTPPRSGRTIANNNCTSTKMDGNS